MNRGVTRHLRQVASVAGVALIGLTAPTRAAVPVEDLVYEGRVVVGPDGNGWMAARFPTAVGGEHVVYYLDVWTAHGDRSAKALGVTLNGEVVFRKAPASTVERTEIALHLVGTTDNEIMVSADGELEAAASFAVVAVWR